MSISSLRPNPNIEMLERSKAFYKQINSDGLLWLSRKVKAETGEYLFDCGQGASSNYSYVYKSIRKFRAIRTAIVAFSIIGFYLLMLGVCYTCFKSDYLSISKSVFMTGFTYTVVAVSVFAFGIPILGLGEIYQKCENMFDAWVKDRWVCTEFEDIVRVVDTICRRYSQKLHGQSIVWMAGTEVERTYVSVPEHVQKICEEVTIRLCYLSKWSEREKDQFASNQYKDTFDRLFEATRRLDIQSMMIDKRVYWNKAIEQLKVEQPPKKSVGSVMKAG